MRSITIKSTEKRLDLYKERVEKILLVRATFRMGHSVLITPAISLFRKRFPNARIDFMGAPVSGKLFHNLPIDHHFYITRRFPHCSWAYLILIKQIRSVGYDLAVDLSCSQSAMGSFIVGFSRARFRVGLQGEWDRWFNVRIPRPAERNKYGILPAFLRSLGLETQDIHPSLVLSSSENEEGRKKIEALACWGGEGRIVGVFVGGRKSWGKRWPIKNFCELITALYWQGVNVVTFFGPDEKNLMGYFSDALEPRIPLIFEPSPRDFAAMVSNCDLFITCDSGPMHLACALGTRTVAIFQNPSFDHWGPPSSLGRVVYEPGGCSVEEVLRICHLELSHNLVRDPDLSGEDLSKSLPLVSIPKIRKSVKRLEKSFFMQRLFFFSRCTQALFVLALIAYALLFPPSGIFAEGTWTEAFSDVVGMGSLLAGGLLRMWAVSHGGKCARLRRPKTPKLITTGPYSFIRHPIYVGNLLIGLGIIFLWEAFPLTPLLLALVASHLTIVIPAEENLLKEKLGEGFDLYCDLVPKYIPRVVPEREFSFGKHFVLNELVMMLGVILTGYVFEWLESPLHRGWIVGLIEQAIVRVS